MKLNDVETKVSEIAEEAFLAEERSYQEIELAFEEFEKTYDVISHAEESLEHFERLLAIEETIDTPTVAEEAFAEATTELMLAAFGNEGHALVTSTGSKDPNFKNHIKNQRGIIKKAVDAIRKIVVRLKAMVEKLITKVVAYFMLSTKSLEEKMEEVVKSGLDYTLGKTPRDKKEKAVLDIATYEAQQVKANIGMINFITSIDTSYNIQKKDFLRDFVADGLITSNGLVKYFGIFYNTVISDIEAVVKSKDGLTDKSTIEKMFRDFMGAEVIEVLKQNVIYSKTIGGFGKNERYLFITKSLRLSILTGQDLRSNELTKVVEKTIEYTNAEMKNVILHNVAAMKKLKDWINKDIPKALKQIETMFSDTTKRYSHNDNPSEVDKVKFDIAKQLYKESPQMAFVQIKSIISYMRFNRAIILGMSPVHPN